MGREGEVSPRGAGTSRELQGPRRESRAENDPEEEHRRRGGSWLGLHLRTEHPWKPTAEQQPGGGEGGRGGGGGGGEKRSKKRNLGVSI